MIERMTAAANAAQKNKTLAAAATILGEASLSKTTSVMDKLLLTGRALGQVFNFRSGCMQTMALTAQRCNTT
jgi:hypothetical protein